VCGAVKACGAAPDGLHENAGLDTVEPVESGGYSHWFGMTRGEAGLTVRE
jgi:hypothetical protein